MIGALFPHAAEAHCDSMDGPVVIAAQKALKTGDVNGVLIWVTEEQESQIRAAFEQTMSVRTVSEEVREMADMYFFETLVRLHRESEGAPYTGIKPAGTDFGPAIPAGDNALETGSLTEVRNLIMTTFEEGLHHRFENLMKVKDFDSKDLKAGRKFVQKYVEFMHYVEPVYETVKAENMPTHAH
jgi:hypothetical protein